MAKPKPEPILYPRPTLTEMIFHMVRVSKQPLDISTVLEVLHDMSKDFDSAKCLKGLQWFRTGDNLHCLEIEDLFCMIGALQMNKSPL